MFDVVEFIQFLNDSPVISMDEHWKPMNLICQPCVINYTFIGSLENIAYDSQHVFNDLSITHIPHFPKWNFPATTVEALRKQVSNVSDEDLRKLISKYADDFSIFRYPTPMI